MKGNTYKFGSRSSPAGWNPQCPMACGREAGSRGLCQSCWETLLPLEKLEWWDIAEERDMEKRQVLLVSWLKKVKNASR